MENFGWNIKLTITHKQLLLYETKGKQQNFCLLISVFNSDQNKIRITKQQKIELIKK